MPVELTPAHVAVLERLVAAGFVPVAFPLYSSAIGIRRGSTAALLVPDPSGVGLRLLGQPCYLLDGNLSVRVLRDGREWFVWKGKQREVAPELLAELSRFGADLAAVLVP